jgi:hypothetical protein
VWVGDCGEIRGRRCLVHVGGGCLFGLCEILSIGAAHEGSIVHFETVFSGIIAGCGFVAIVIKIDIAC